MIRMLVLKGMVLALAAGECLAVRPYEPMQPDPVLESWRWRSFPELKGLGLQCMVEDRYGNMWFGTDGGVRRYDGLNWKVYTPEDGLLGAPVWTLCAARDSSVYAGTEMGISRFREGVWRRVFPPEGDLFWYVLDLMEASDGSLWAGTEWGALHLSARGATLYTNEEIGAAVRMLAPYVRVSIVPDRVAPIYPWTKEIPIGIRITNQGIIWALASGGPEAAAGLKAGDRITAVDGAPGVTQGRLNGPVGSQVRLTVQREGRSGPFEVSFTRGPVEGTYRRFKFADVFEDRDGAMWFGLLRGEIVRYDARGTGPDDPAAWRLYTEQDGLDTGNHPRIAQTRDGTIWTVSDNSRKGVNRFDGKTWARFRLQDLGGYDHSTSILETGDGTLWVGGKFALHALRDGKWHVYRSGEVPVPSHRVRLLEASDGALWVAGLGQEAVRLDYRTGRWMSYKGLYFQCETPDGSQWFVARDTSGMCSVVRRAPSAGSGQGGGRWTRYGVEDGLMDFPRRLIATRQGALWAAGSHQNTAATARFNGKGWSLKVHPRLSWSINTRGVYESPDGALWFGADIPWNREHRFGLLRFEGRRSGEPGTWTHYAPPGAPIMAYGIGQTADGTIWAGGYDLARFDGRSWTLLKEPKALTVPFINVVYATAKGDLWVGHRSYGIFHYNGQAWTRYDVRNGLADNAIGSILRTVDGSVWAGTEKGISRFDGRSWTTHAVSPDLHLDRAGSLRQSRDGALWINTMFKKESRWVWHTIRYRPDTDPPETEITLFLREVSQPGNTPLAWTGADPWRITPEEDLQYAWRLDGGEWSAFSAERSRIFQTLASGAHTFEVKARDQDFNEDATPAVMQFTVVPVVWRQPWFIAMVVVFVGTVTLQASRIVVRDRKLKQANTALRDANDALKQEMAERARLDAQLEHMRYLHRLRAALEPARSAEAVIRNAGGIMVEVLEGATSAGVLIEHDGREWRFGEGGAQGRVHYKRPIAWGAKERGRLHLFSSVALSQSQEGALLDETAGQIARALEARELEMQILQSARLVSLGQMAAGVAHELKQPLTVIETTAGDVCSRLMEGLDLPPEDLREMMQKVRKVVERMAGTVDHMRVFSRDVSEEPRRAFSLNEIIHNSLRIIGAQLKNHGIELTLDLAGDLPLVWGHPYPMEQVFMNLLGNARDALDERARQDAGGNGAFEKRVAVRTRCETYGIRWVVVQVEDNGIGMEVADRERIFEPFFTTKEADQGTGLGLSISYAIVQNHHGRISCESSKGKGTIFRVVLPVSEGK